MEREDIGDLLALVVTLNLGYDLFDDTEAVLVH